MSLISLCENGRIPDALTRVGIRRLCGERLQQEHADDLATADVNFRRRLDALRNSPLAIETDAANRQHYEVPTAFFQQCLGKRLKYSGCYYATGNETLDDAEETMLALCCERACLADGQRVLELGCGWGSLTLWMAEHYPNARIVGVSNSASQRDYILKQCRERGFDNVEILTCDVNTLQLDAKFDRVVSVEMFEHVRNYRLLFERIAGWLEADGSLFAHIFCHRYLMYPFDDERNESDWMARHFFTGGLMPSADTFLHFQDHLLLRERWLLPGTHYQRTANHWLANHDAHRGAVLEILGAAYGASQARIWNQRWRMFWMACAELFGYRDGNQWLVAHYLFDKR